MAISQILPDPLPVSGREIANVPKDERISAEKLKDFVVDEFRRGQTLRRQRSIAWVMIQSYLRSMHFFTIDKLGRWRPIPKDEKVRVAVPLIVPMYRHVLGFFNSNEVGVTATPVASGTSKAFYKSDRAEAAINGWIEETDFESVFDRGNQLLLTEGFFGYYRFIDPFRQNVFVRAIGGSQIYPIPFDATDPSEVSGYIVAGIVSKQWLELQDDILERKLHAEGKPMTRRMADRSKGLSSGMSLSYPFLGGAFDQKVDGSLTLSVFMNETPQTPGGEYMFIVDEEMFRYASGDETIPILGRNKNNRPTLPIEITHFDKNPSEFCGSGFCETLISMQAAKDRSRSLLERSAKYNRSFSVFDNKAIDPKDVQSEDAAFIPADFGRLSSRVRSPLIHFPATTVGRDVLSVLQLQDSDADRASGFRSGIVFGQQEGRTESGPATSLLSNNAMSSILPALKRHEGALKRTFRGALDMFRLVWPAGKAVRVIGPNNVGREILFSDPKELPWSDEIMLQARPLVPGGKQALVNVLFQLRNMPGPDGQMGTEVSSREFRQSLKRLNFLPPGISLADKADARIRTRINLLVGDTQKPSVQASEPGNTQDRLMLEDHRLAVEMYKEVILDDSFLAFSPRVQQGLLKQFEFHRQLTIAGSGHPQDFDDDVAKMISAQQEQFIAGAESGLDGSVGDFLGSEIDNLSVTG